MSERHFEDMSSFIPDFDRVKTAYVADATDETKYAVAEEDMPLPEEAGAEFDRFIAKVREEAKAETRADFVLTRANIRRIKVDALREAAMKLQDGIGSCNTGCHVSDMVTLRTLADRIEGEA